MKDYETNQMPLIIAHRGASSHAPENTLAALQMAVDAGADGVEFDVRLARDGVPVVVHDATLGRVAGFTEKVSDFTSKQLERIDIGSRFNAKYPDRARLEFAGQTIPTLSHTLDLLKDFHGLIYIELKCGEADYCELTKVVCRIVRDAQLSHQVIIKSFMLAVIPQVKQYLSQAQTAVLFQPTVQELIKKRKYMLYLASDMGADQVSLHYLLVTRDLATRAAKMHMPLSVWTINNPKWLQNCRSLGIRALITNDPAKMLYARQKKWGGFPPQVSD